MLVDYTKNAKDTVTAVLTAGMDTDCGGFMNSKAMTPLMADPAIGATQPSLSPGPQSYGRRRQPWCPAGAWALN